MFLYHKKYMPQKNIYHLEKLVLKLSHFSPSFMKMLVDGQNSTRRFTVRHWAIVPQLYSIYSPFSKAGIKILGQDIVFYLPLHIPYEFKILNAIIRNLTPYFAFLIGNLKLCIPSTKLSKQ